MSSFPTLFRFPFARPSFPAAHGESLAARWRARLCVDGLEDRHAPASLAPAAIGPVISHAGAIAPASSGALSPIDPVAPTPPTKHAAPPTTTPAISAAALLVLFPPVVLANVPTYTPPAAIIPPPAPPIAVNVYPNGPSWEQPPLELRNVPVQATMLEGETITFTAKADFGDQPAEHPHFSLEPVEGAQFPEGASIDPETGAFAWEPTPGIYAFWIRVDDGDNTARQIVHLRVKEKVEAGAAETPGAALVEADAAIPAPARQPGDALHSAALSALAVCGGAALLKPGRGRRLAA